MRWSALARRLAVEGLGQPEEQQDPRHGGQQRDERFLDGHSLSSRFIRIAPFTVSRREARRRPFLTSPVSDPFRSALGGGIIDDVHLHPAPEEDRCVVSP
jgi:hypothetical protein